MASPVLVTGGTGRLGKLVVAQLQDSGCDVRVLARHDRATPQGVTFFTADLRTGQGIEPAVTAAAAIIHCATSTRGDAEATRNLVAVASRTGSAHLVYVSIVGIDHIASWGYPKTKLQAEQIVASSGLPWTILRVTQFYDYCLTNAKKLSWFPLAPVPAGFIVQPVDPRDVAVRLVELALGEPACRAPDMAGPQVSSWTDLLRGYLKASDRRRWVVPVRVPGTRAVRNGALLPGPGHTAGSRTWDQFLTTQLRQQATAHRLARPAGRPRGRERYPGSINRVERQIMSLNIKNAETYRLVQELAALTGETQTAAVTIAVRERLDRVRHLRQAGLAERLLTIGADTAPRLHEPWRSADHGDLLYDEHGLPA